MFTSIAVTAAAGAATTRGQQYMMHEYAYTQQKIQIQAPAATAAAPRGARGHFRLVVDSDNLSNVVAHGYRNHWRPT